MGFSQLPGTRPFPTGPIIRNSRVCDQTLSEKSGVYCGPLIYNERCTHLNYCSTTRLGSTTPHSLKESYNEQQQRHPLIPSTFYLQWLLHPIQPTATVPLHSNSHKPPKLPSKKRQSAGTRGQRQHSTYLASLPNMPSQKPNSQNTMLLTTKDTKTSSPTKTSGLAGMAQSGANATADSKIKKMPPQMTGIRSRVESHMRVSLASLSTCVATADKASRSGT